MDSWIRIAHRGASGIAPENTLAAFNKAIEIGVDAVELDLHGTADGEIVVIHDPSLDRTTDMCGLINQNPLAVIKQADAGAWFHSQFKGETIPTLDETLVNIADKTIAVLEIKDSSITQAVVKKVIDMSLLERVVIISFNISDLHTVRTIEPSIPTGWLIGSNNEHTDPIQLCQKLCSLGSNLLNVNHLLISEEFAYEIRKRGISLWTWTVDDIDRMLFMRDIGVQGITSNHPEYFHKF